MGVAGPRRAVFYTGPVMANPPQPRRATGGGITIGAGRPLAPEIIAPEDGDILPHDAHLLISWKKVTGPILPTLGPVEIVGYHALVVDVTQPVLPPGKTKTSLDADLSRSETSFLVPKQYLEPNRIYEFEILAIEKGGNQPITEGGVFCTPPITPENCIKP